jgi:hypothetical protein
VLQIFTERIDKQLLKRRLPKPAECTPMRSDVCIFCSAGNGFADRQISNFRDPEICQAYTREFGLNSFGTPKSRHAMSRDAYPGPFDT